ncbi:DUF2510 domain-containing protein [Agromyces neolithicus]|uniref:DUF2510 domain-containing protein n=1 Tax=Agromyces neolithicus TaxID=269420 RepID=A0ABN2M8F1_9MICO
MSDPTRAPAGWYEDGSGARRYWNGDAWTQYVAPEPVTEPLPQVGPDTSVTAVLPVGDENPTIRFVWGSQGADAPAPGYDARPTAVLAEHPFTEPSNPAPNAVGLIAVPLAVLGLGLAFIPAASGFAWILVTVAFVLALIGLFRRGPKWPAITALVVSIIAAVVGIVMFVGFLIGSVGDVIDEAIPEVPIFPQPSDDPGADPAPEPEQPVPPGAPVEGELAFGETMTWDDGVALTVSAPEPYTPSEFALGATNASNVVFTLTLTNNSSADLQPLPLPAVSSGDQEVSQIFDIGSDVIGTGDDVGFPPAATIEPGESVTWRAAWSLDDPSSLTMQVAPSFLYPSATFTNAP